MTQSTLKATATSWKPSSDNTSNTNTQKTTTARPTTAGAAGAWGKKKSNAVRKAAPIQPAPSSQGGRSGYSRQNNSNSNNNNNNNGWRRGVKQQQDNSNNNNNNNNSGRGGRGRGNRHNRNRNYHDNNNDVMSGGWQRGKSLPVELLKPQEGTTPAQKAVTRITVETLLALRMSYVAPPLLWTEQPDLAPSEPALWTSPTRVSEIDAMHKAGRVAGDVSNNNKRRNQNSNKQKDHETAPPLEECAPLEVNEETRWKSSIFKDSDKKNTDDDEESDEDIMKKALLVLNKLSLTKFDKLSDAFIDTGIGRNEECLKEAISLIVNKAQSEPHFSNMYASLCLKLGKTPMEALGEEGKKKGKKFKKLLLQRCQQEFEEDTAHKIARMTKDITDPAEVEYHANIVKKNYLGHMIFIGELYKGDMIRISIMMFCLYDLLGMDTSEFIGKTESPEDEDDAATEEEAKDQDTIEKKLECFTKLMTTIGLSLEQQTEAAKESGKGSYWQQFRKLWKTVEGLAKKDKKGAKVKISNRIKFMLQDLIDMRSKGWKTRRKVETAKTIEQIHKEVAKEEQRAMKKRGSSSNLRRMGSRSGSSNNIQKLERSKSAADADGFVTVSSGKGGGNSNMNRSMSHNTLRRSTSESGWSRRDSSSSSSKLPRSSSGSSFSALMEESKKSKGSKSKSTGEKAPTAATTSAPAPTPAPKKEFKDPQACGKSAANVFKEYFVGGDTDDAVLSIFELIGSESDAGSLERGVAVVESTCGYVLEGKAEQVDKYLTVLTRCLAEEKLSVKMVEGGISGLLEFLADIIIDAPLAGTHMAKIVGALMKNKTFQFDSLLNAPEYFRTDGKAAQFAAKAMKQADMMSDANCLEVVEKLMTEEDKESFPTAAKLLESV